MSSDLRPITGANSTGVGSDWVRREFVDPEPQEKASWPSIPMLPTENPIFSVIDEVSMCDRKTFESLLTGRWPAFSEPHEVAPDPSPGARAAHLLKETFRDDDFDPISI